MLDPDPSEPAFSRETLLSNTKGEEEMGRSMGRLQTQATRVREAGLSRVAVPSPFLLSVKNQAVA